MSRQRRMTLPSIPGREDPIYKPATTPASDPAHGAAFIFVHGLGDDAEGLEGDSFHLYGQMPDAHCMQISRTNSNRITKFLI